jgi:3-oxosteroid 1-dehydrogenase
MSGELVVMGSGGAGLVAALHAATRGAKVTVLESAPVFGGTTALSGGGQWTPLNRLGQEEFGLQDSRAEVITYLDALTLGLIPHETLDGFLDSAPRYVEFLIANTTCDVVAADIPDYYQGRPGAKGPGRTVTIGLYDTARLGEYQKLLREPPWPGSVGPITSNEERDAGWGADRRLFELGNERRANGIAARGRALIAGLMEACLENGVRLVAGARVVSAIIQDGRIRSVEADRDGTLESFPTELGLILACGGFEWNRKLWDGMVGVPLDGALSPPYNVGDGLSIATKAGARLGNMGQVWWNPSIQIPGETYDGAQRNRGATLRQRAGAITVNRRGQRFFNENLPYNDAGRPLTYFDPHTYSFINYPAHSIADKETVDRAPLLTRDFTTPITSEWLFEAPTLRELAAKIGVDADGLEAQVKKWNADCEKGVDADFHRGEKEYDITRDAWDTVRRAVGDGTPNGLLRPIKDGPYFATRLRPVCYGTKGGPVIDGSARALGYDDQPVPGLFAAGNVSAGIFGHAYPGGGGTLGAALVMGWKAGESATS